MMRLPTLIALLAATLMACSAVDPTISALERSKGLAASGGYETIAAEDVGCAPNQRGCGQLHAIRADACQRTADAASDRPAQRRWLDCSISESKSALAAIAVAPDPAVDPGRIEPALLESLARRRDLSEQRAEAVQHNEALRTQAASTMRGRNPRPAGFVFAADAELSAVQLEGGQGGCQAIGRAAQLLRDAQADATPFEAKARALERAAANLGRARGCTA